MKLYLKENSVLLFLAIVLSFAFAFITKDFFSGDSSIYFTYFKNFFTLPFSYQPNHVNFGSTSPMHTLIFSCIYALSGDNWIFVVKFFNFLFIELSFLILISFFKNKIILFFVLNTLFLMPPLMFFAGQVYETGIIFLSLALLILFLKKNEYTKLIILSGSLYLVRPEMALFTIYIYLYVIFKKRDKNILLLMFLSLMPNILYHVYVAIMSYEFIPTSVYGRYITAIENQKTYLERLFFSLSFIRSNILYIILIFVYIVAIVYALLRKQNYILLILIGLVFALYLINPPGYLILRYLSIALPLMFYICIFLIDKLMVLRRFYLLSFTVFVFFCMGFVKWIDRAEQKTYLNDLTLNDILLKDLSLKLNPILQKNDKILIYEIQGQYYIDAYCISLDSIVGSDFLNVNIKKQSFLDFLNANHDVKYIVTMNSFDYRRIYKDMFLSKLYLHDLNSNMGESIKFHNYLFTKILTNPKFLQAPRTEYIIEDLNSNNGYLKLYNGRHPMWNSVYKIETIDE